MGSRQFCFLVLVVLFALPVVGRSAHALGGSTISAPLGSNVTVDGILDPSEWSDATHVSFSWAWSNSSLSSQADLWVKNNGTNLLVAASATGRTIPPGSGNNGYTYALNLLFNDNNNGTLNNYDAEKFVYYSSPPGGYGWRFVDLHYNSNQGSYVYDTSPNGTGTGSFSNYGGPGTWYWEFSIPMKSSSPESFNLPVNGTIGFEIIYQEYQLLNYGTQVIGGFSYWPAPYTTAGPSGPKPSANGWANLVRSNSGLQTPPTTPTTPWYLNTWTFVGIALGIGAVLSSTIVFARRKRRQPILVQ